MHDSSTAAMPAAPLTTAEQAVVDEVLRRLRDLPGALLPILHGIQEQLGFVPPAALAPIADAMNLSRAEVHGVVTFYHDFRQRKPGRTVLKLCRAEACQAMGCRQLEERLASVHGASMGQTTADGALTVEPVYCLGNCALAPAMQVDGALRGRVDAAALDRAVAEARRKEPR